MLLKFVGKFIIRGGQVGNKVALSARRNGLRGAPPGAQGTYFQDGADPAHALTIKDLETEIDAMDVEDAIKLQEEHQQQLSQKRPKKKRTGSDPSAVHPETSFQKASSGASATSLYVTVEMPHSNENDISEEIDEDIEIKAVRQKPEQNLNNQRRKLPTAGNVSMHQSKPSKSIGTRPSKAGTDTRKSVNQPKPKPIQSKSPIKKPPTRVDGSKSSPSKPTRTTTNQGQVKTQTRNIFTIDDSGRMRGAAHVSSVPGTELSPIGSESSLNTIPHTRHSLPPTSFTQKQPMRRSQTQTIMPN